MQEIEISWWALELRIANSAHLPVFVWHYVALTSQGHHIFEIQ